MLISKSTRALCAVAVLTALAAVTGCGIGPSPHDPGYVALEDFRQPGLKRDARFSIGPRLLKFAASHNEDDPEAEIILKALDGVQVEIYQLTAADDLDAISARLSGTASRLLERDWTRALSVVEDDQTVQILVRENEAGLRGIAIVALDREELVLVNLMGDLTPQALAGLSDSVPEADSFSRQLSLAQLATR